MCIILGRFVQLQIKISVKLEHILVEYLYNNKEVALQGIGSFSLNPSVSITDENTKDFSIPTDAITFQYDLKASEDEGLIDFIVKKTGKIKPLASADLDSFIVLAKQFLNIGKPFTIEGLGVVQKNQQGEYFFTPGQFMPPVIDVGPIQLKEKKIEAISFENEVIKQNGNGTLKTIAIISIILIATIAVYFLFFNKKKNSIINNNVEVLDTLPTIDSSRIDSTKLTITNDTISKNIDSTTFKVVIKEYNSKESAEKYFNKITAFGHKVDLIEKDSTHFQVIMKFYTPISDSLRAKDSLRKFFGGSPLIAL